MSTTADAGRYRIRIRRDGVELEVEGPDRAYVDEKTAELLLRIGLDGAPSRVPPPSGTPNQAVEAGKPPSLVEHVRKVVPNGGLEHVLAVGYYLEHHEGMAGGFRRRDLGRAFKVLGYNHSNPGVPIAAARKQGLLMNGAEADKIRLSETADEWVRARLRGE